MLLNTIKRIAVFVLLLWVSTAVYGQLSKVHYIPPLPYLGVENNSDYFKTVHIYVSTPEPTATFTIRPLGGAVSDWSPEIVVTKENSYKGMLTPSIIGALPQDLPIKNVFSNKGYQIVSDKEIYVSIRAKHPWHAGAIVSKGSDGLGKRFRLAGMERTTNSDMSFFSIVSTQNNTTINFTSDPTLITSQGGPLTPNVTLNKHEVFIAIFEGENVVKNIGTLVESNKDIIVNTGTMYGSFSNEIINPPYLSPFDRTDYYTGGDMGMDQLVSITPSIEAKEYILVKGDSFESIENALIIADEDGTTIEINGSSYTDPESGSSTLDAGEHFFIEGTSFSSGGPLQYMHIKSNKNIYVFQGTGDKYLVEGSVEDSRGDKIGVSHNYSANQGMFFVPPLNCASTGDVESIARIDEVDASAVFQGSFFVLSKAGSMVEVNGNDINSIPNNTVNVPIGGVDAYTIHRVDDRTGDIAIKGDDELYVSYFNVNSAATSGAFYSGFTLEPKISPELSISTLGSCVFDSGASNVSFNISSAAYSGFDEFKWQKYDDITGAWENIFGSSIKDPANYDPSAIGQYRAAAKIYCLTSPDIYSEPIVVGFCPADFDQDGVIDNLDRDKDNDGIFNADESYGDFPLDLTNVNTPSISFPAGAPTTISSSITNVNATLSGDANGRLSSSFSSNTVGKVEAEFTFDKSVTLVLSYASLTSRVISDNETFKIKSIDIKNPITLLNPNNELLIDTNLDGIYESDIQQFSGSLIHFTFNSSVTGGSYGFSFIKSTYGAADGIVFSHAVDNNSSQSAFNANLTLINYGKDSDANGLFDEVELDSDGDGCPDYIEAGFTNENNPEKFGDHSLNVDTGEINPDGTVSAHDYTKPIKTNGAGDYYFQINGSADIATFSTVPTNVQVSVEEEAVFTVNSPNATYYQWFMDNSRLTDDSIFSGTNTNSLEINTAGLGTTLDGKNFHVEISNDKYLCVSPSSSATLSVLALPPIPILNRVYSFCGTGTVAELKDLIDSTKTFNVYDEETGGSPLLDTDTLINGEDYYVSAVNAAGGESVIRSFTNVVVADPALTSNAPSDEICLGESVTLTAQGVPYTFSEFEDSLDSSFEYITTFIDPVTSEVSHYFLKKQSMPWTAARNLIKSLGSGASMYVINSKKEEEDVFNAMSAYTGTEDNHFWLGLRQIDALANGKFDEGWVWLDGRPLTAADENWYNYPASEPNDYDYTKPDGSTRPNPPPYDYDGFEDGSENYAQFDYTPAPYVETRKEWNDMKNDGGGGNSWPVFEFQGVTQVKWFKQEPGKTPEEIIGETSNTLTITPTVTGNITYSYKIFANANGTTFSCPTTIDITVNELPDIDLFPAEDMELCDNNLDGDPNTNEASFNLDAQRKKIISATDRDVFFYESNTKALSVSDSISTATPYTSNPKDIYYRVKDKTTGCFGADADIDSFALIVNDLPPILSIPDLHECDDTSFGTDKDGLHEFDLTQKNTDIKDALIALGKDPTNYKLTYHALKNDTTPITTYKTVAPDAGEKEIFVRIEDNKGCVRYDNSFKVIVDKLPELKTTSITLEQCESDGQIKYNLNSLKSQYSANSANETFEFYLDASFSTSTKILTPENFVVPVGVLTQDVFIKIIDNNSSCERFDDLVSGVRKPIKVSFVSGANAVPTSFVPLEFPPYCFDSVTSTTPGFGVFEPSIFIEIKDAVIASAKNEGLNYDSPNVEIRFYENEQDAIYQINEIDTALPYTNSDIDDQEIWVGIEDVGVSKIECLGRFKVADLLVRPKPVFDLPPTFVFCQNLGSDTISVTSPSETYDYAWERNGVPITTQLTQNLIITEGGTYSVTATNPTTGCTTTKTVEVKTSEIALFDADDVTIYDLTGDGSNRIEIDNSEAALGIGDYKFALNGGAYQDSPIFENVPPGIHTLYVRDKNGCGDEELEISVIGYPLYFTPNGDGQNDTWQILGVNASFQPSSLIYIFDRHGRLMAQIPADGIGWNGTYNGTIMPADDYWFRVKLQDGRSFTGHFSLVR